MMLQPRFCTAQLHVISLQLILFKLNHNTRRGFKLKKALNEDPAWLSQMLRDWMGLLTTDKWPKKLLTTDKNPKL